MNSVLLIISIITQVAQQMCRKEYNKKANDKPLSFSIFAIVATLLYFLAISRFNLQIEKGMFTYVIPFALCFTATYIFTFLSIQHGPLSLTSLMISCSVVVPLIYGVVFLDEPLTRTLTIGLVLLLLSVICVSEPWKKENAVISTKWIIYISLTFLSNGICTSIQKYFQVKDRGAHSNEFMICSLAITFIILLIFVMFKERQGAKSVIKTPSVLWPVLCGITNGMANQFTMFLAVVLPASFLYPIQSAGGIILTAVVSVIVYKEKLSTTHKIGFVAGVLAVIAFNL